MAESLKGVEIPWSETSFSVSELVQLFRDELPVLVKVNEDYHGPTDAETFMAGENLRVSALRNQRRVLCHDPGNHRYLSIPVESFPARVHRASLGQGPEPLESVTLQELIDKSHLPIVVTVLPLAKGQRTTVGSCNLTSGRVKLKLLECFDEPFLLAHSFVPEVPLVDHHATPILLSTPLKLQFCRVTDNTDVAAFEQAIQDVLRRTDLSRHGNPTHIVTYPGDKRPRMTANGPEASRRSSDDLEGAVCLPHTADPGYISMDTITAPPVPLRKPQPGLSRIQRKTTRPSTPVELKVKVDDEQDENINRITSRGSGQYETFDPDGESESPELPGRRVLEETLRPPFELGRRVLRLNRPLPPLPTEEASEGREKIRFSDTY